MPDLPPRQAADVRSDLDRETFEREYAVPGKPVVIRGATADWPALTKWSYGYFAQTYGHLQVRVYRAGGTPNRRMSLAQFLAYAEVTGESNPFYLGNWEFGNDCPSLLEDYRNPELFERLEGRLPGPVRPEWRWMFIGPSGTGSPMHADVMLSSAWNAVITGRKRWLFFPPDQTNIVYRGEVNCFAPDYDKFPLFRQATALECVQEPGDLVFTPSGWWHQVRNEVGGISVTENFINRANLDYVRSAALMKNLPDFYQALAALG